MGRAAGPVIENPGQARGQADEEVVTAFGGCASELEAFARVLTRDSQTADDLVGEAFLRLLIQARAGRMPMRPGAWLHRVVLNEAASRGRHARVVARAAPLLAAPRGAEPVERAADRYELDEEVLRALGSLRPDARVAIVLAAEGYSGCEIGERIGRSGLATRALLCRSRRRLRRELVAV
jgi:RNA polymerase sigma factor (sigma-70 family)